MTVVRSTRAKLMVPSVNYPRQVVMNLANVNEEGVSVSAATREMALQAAQVCMQHWPIFLIHFSSFVPIWNFDHNYSFYETNPK